jgi:hypothetical protein
MYDSSLSQLGTYVWQLTFPAWYTCMTAHFPSLVHMYDSSLSQLGTYVWQLTFPAWYRNVNKKYIHGIQLVLWIQSSHPSKLNLHYHNFPYSTCIVTNNALCEYEIVFLYIFDIVYSLIYSGHFWFVGNKTH